MNQLKKTFKVLGIMSGTSLDGLDLCLVDFTYFNQQWHFKIVETECINYSNSWQEKLKHAHLLTSQNLVALDREYGRYIGKCAQSFIKSKELDLIASHGHTIFHQPNKGYSLQIGHGGEIATKCRCKVVSDFRSQDISKGGQGAPLVPIGDALLFKQYKACINIGGITNLSFDLDNKRIAFDAAPSNLIINYLSQTHFNIPFDKNGEIGKRGQLISSLFNSLNKIPFYQKDYPKSLGRENIEKDFFPLFEQNHEKGQDLLFTFYKHWAFQIAKLLKVHEIKTNILLSGGGTKNSFLIECLKAEGIHPIIPDVDIIDFKEAMIFGFLGLCRIKNINNVLHSVTGASHDHCSGAVFLP